ncbi:major facilitator superfamily domain-containing protein [Xylariales sp. PMI_506]|nr:major facilitator superfamily domain-containing protein [Xylariales sp. PMI_506]
MDVSDEKRANSVAVQPRVIPDSGVQAWLQVLGAFCLYFNTWGLLSSYGSFQAFYEADLLKNSTTFQISTIGSLQSFLLVFLGFLAGPIYDSGYSKHLLLSGSFLVVVGTVCQSFCTELWHLLLAQGVCIGVGCGCLAILSVAIPSVWFTTRLPLANGIAATGSGVGGAILPIIIRNLLPVVGFGWTVRVIALLALVLLGTANLVLQVPEPSKRRRRLLDRESLTDWPYVLFVIGCFTVFLGIYSPFFYIQSFATASGSTSENVAFYITTAMNVASIPGRIIPTLFAKRFSPLDLIVGTSFALAACGLGFLGAKNVGSIYAVAIIYGFWTGSFFALQPTNFVQLTADLRIVGTRFGMAFTVMSVALLFGSPISGALQDAYDYNASWAWVGATISAGGCVIGLARVQKAASKRA